MTSQLQRQVLSGNEIKCAMNEHGPLSISNSNSTSSKSEVVSRAPIIGVEKAEDGLTIVAVAGFGSTGEDCAFSIGLTVNDLGESDDFGVKDFGGSRGARRFFGAFTGGKFGKAAGLDVRAVETFVAAGGMAANGFEANEPDASPVVSKSAS